MRPPSRSTPSGPDGARLLPKIIKGFALPPGSASASCRYIRSNLFEITKDCLECGLIHVRTEPTSSSKLAILCRLCVFTWLLTDRIIGVLSHIDARSFVSCQHICFIPWLGHFVVEANPGKKPIFILSD